MKRIAFRVDSGPGIGMGHYYRCHALADALDAECVFNPASYAGFDCIIVDVLDIPIEDRVELTGCPSVTLADIWEWDLPGDVVINGFLTGCGNDQTKTTSWGGVAYLGAKYKIVRAKPGSKPTIPDRAKYILITAGGGDASGVTILALNALRHVPGPLCIRVIEGPLFNVSKDYLRALVRYPHEITFTIAINEPPPFSDLAITAGGDTAYELAALGVPMIIMSHVEHQLVTARAFQDNGIGYDVGLTKQQGAGLMLSRIIESLINHPATRASMSRRGRLCVDGRGLERVVEIVENLI